MWGHQPINKVNTICMKAKVVNIEKGTKKVSGPFYHPKDNPGIMTAREQVAFENGVRRTEQMQYWELYEQSVNYQQNS